MWLEYIGEDYALLPPPLNGVGDLFRLCKRVVEVLKHIFTSLCDTLRCFKDYKALWDNYDITRALIGWKPYMLLYLDRNIEILFCFFSIGYFIKEIENIDSMLEL
jgi:hypothetical protein